MLEKNRVFEEQAPGTLEAMIGINNETDEVIARAVEDLKGLPTFLADVKQSILRCHEIENRAFEALSGVVAESGL